MADRAQRLSPLTGVALSSAPGALLRDAGPAVRFIFRGSHAAATAVGTAFGAALPVVPRGAASAGSRHALWLGPDEWLLLAFETDADRLSSSLREALGAEPSSLVDVSHRNVGLLLEGPRAPDVLSTGCPLDLCIESFPAGMCVRTVFGKAEVILWRTAPQTFHVEAWRSFLPYVVGLLEAGTP